MDIDYKDLLRRYMAAVEVCEGTDFVSKIKSWEPDKFSEAEIAELKSISQANYAKITAGGG